jgi:hypothetical protein
MRFSFSVKLIGLQYRLNTDYLLAILIKRLTYINFDYKTCYAIMQVNDTIGREESQIKPEVKTS